MGKKTPGKGPGCFKYAKFLIFDDTLQPQKFVPGMCKIAHNLTLKYVLVLLTIGKPCVQS